ncbi:kinesin motor protein cin8, partial [Modicella reniformis]
MKTCIITTISPARFYLEETISPINYTNRAKNIKDTPEIDKEDRHTGKERSGVFMTKESYRTLLDVNSSTKDLAKQKFSLSNTWLEVKRAEVQELKVELMKTKQDLQEETVLRQAHPQIESQLDTAASAQLFVQLLKRASWTTKDFMRRWNGKLNSITGIGKLWFISRSE